MRTLFKQFHKNFVLTSFLFLFIAGTTANAKDEPNLCKAPSPVKETELNPKSIEKYVLDNQLKHPHDLICCLPESMRKNYVIVTESFSAQGGAEEFKDGTGKIPPHKMAPRVILFSDGKPTDPVDLSISFNGLPEQRNHFNLEMMSFEKKPKDQNHHGFFDLNFRDNVPPDKKNAADFTNVSNHLKLSEKNPTKCAACHGRTLVPEEFAKVRPRWDSNPFWPRTFGSDPIGVAPDHLTNFERENRKAFQELAKTIPGYKCLVDIQGRMSRPFGMTDANTEYSLRIAAGNQYRIAKLLSETDDYSKYKYAIVGSLIGCHNKQNGIDQFLPETVRQKHDSREHLMSELREAPLNDATLADIASKAKDFHVDRSRIVEKAKQLQNNVGEPLSRFIIDTYVRQGVWTMETSKSIASLRYMMEGRGIYIGDYSIDVEESRYRFNNATRFGRSEAVYIAEKLIQSDQDLQNKDFSSEISRMIENVRQQDAPGIARNGSETVASVSIAENGPTKACEQLKAHSLNAFHNPGTNSNTNQAEELRGAQ